MFGVEDPETLLKYDNQRVLQAVKLIKDKRCGYLKSRTYAYEIPQRNYIFREEETSPTTPLEVIFVSLIIGVHEGREVHTFDAPGAYLHASLPGNKEVIMKFEG